MYSIHKSRFPRLFVLNRLLTEFAFLGRDLVRRRWCDLELDLVLVVVVEVLRLLWEDVDLLRAAGIATKCSLALTAGEAVLLLPVSWLNISR